MHKNKSYVELRSVFMRIAAILSVFIICISCISCIKRNNDFDPIFKHKSVLPCTQDTISGFQKKISATLSHTDLIGKEALEQQRILLGNDSIISLLQDFNQGILRANAMTTLENIEIENFNKNQKTSDSLHYKHPLDTLPFAQIKPTTIIELLSANSKDSMVLFSLFAEMDNRCPDFEVKVISQIDSARSIFMHYTDQLLSLKASIDSVERSIDNMNLWIFDSTLVIKQKNILIQLYNDSIYSVQWAVRIKNFPLITTGEDLKSQVNQAQAGDTFIIEGQLALGGNLPFSSIRGSSSDHISFIGNPQTENSISVHSGIFISSCEYIDFSNLLITGSRGSGLRLENNSSNITIKNCIIERNENYGIEIAISGMTITDCIIRNNGKGGIQSAPFPTDYPLNLSNVLIVKNGGIGLDLTTPLANLKYVTISHNTSDGIHIVSPIGSALSVFNSIISYNHGFGIFREISNPGGTIDLSAIDFFQNSSGNLSSNLSGTFWNYDPNYSDTTNNNFSIAPWGKIYEFQTLENLVIGYR